MYKDYKAFCFRELDPLTRALDPAGSSASRPPLEVQSVVHPTFLDLTTPLIRPRYAHSKTYTL